MTRTDNAGKSPSRLASENARRHHAYVELRELLGNHREFPDDVLRAAIARFEKIYRSIPERDANPGHEASFQEIKEYGAAFDKFHKEYTKEVLAELVSLAHRPLRAAFDRFRETEPELAFDALYYLGYFIDPGVFSKISRRIRLDLLAHAKATPSLPAEKVQKLVDDTLLFSNPKTPTDEQSQARALEIKRFGRPAIARRKQRDADNRLMFGG